MTTPTLPRGHQPPDGPMVPGGFDLADECTSPTGDLCLRDLRMGLALPADLCAACRRVHRELLDSVLDEPAGDDGGRAAYERELARLRSGGAR